MIQPLISQALVTALLLLGTTLLAETTLFSDGQSEVAIIVPEGKWKYLQMPASRLTSEGLSVPLAAVELADYLEKISGERPILATETQNGVAAASRIYLGPCQANLALFRDALPGPEEFMIRTHGSDIHIFGGDIAPGGAPCQGTLFGVYDFLERELGVRWLFPGEYGEVVPKQRSITIAETDRRDQPRIEKRKVRNQAVTREDTYAPILAQWGIPLEAWKAAHGPEATGAWFRRMRLGQRLEINGGHAYDDWWEKYGDAHPEWFALQPDGTRTQNPVRPRLCKSNVALQDEIARVKLAEFKADSGLLTASISPNDGGRNKFCMCQACRSLDPNDAPKLLNDSQLIDPETGLPFPEYAALSDRVFTFFNGIAARVRREMPDRSLVAYAYSLYRTPPVNLPSLEPNLIIGYVGLNLDEIEKWSRIAPRLYIRPNDLGPAIDLGLPRNHAVHLADAVKFSVDHKAIGFDFDNCHGNWSSHGLDYYVLCKALWNPDLDIAATIADYCSSAYGPGAGAMLHYLDGLESISDQVRLDPELAPRSPHAANLRHHYSGKALTALESYLDEARAAIAASDPAALARVEMAAESVRYARLVTALLEVAHEKDSHVYKERLTAVEEMLKNKILTPELAGLHSHRYLRMALAYAEREVE